MLIKMNGIRKIFGTRFDRGRDRNLNRYLSRLERNGRASFYGGRPSVRGDC